MGLRANGYQDLQPKPCFGNAMSIAIIQPPSNSSPATQQTDSEQLSEPPSTAEAQQPDSNQANSNEHIELSAAAACAVRLATEAFWADPAGNTKQLMSALPALVDMHTMSNPEASPFKGCCVDVVSWRNMFNEDDFGQGTAALTLGAALPTLVNISWVIDGLDHDGVFITMWLLEELMDTVLTAQILQKCAPEAQFVQSEHAS